MPSSKDHVQFQRSCSSYRFRGGRSRKERKSNGSDSPFLKLGEVVEETTQCVDIIEIEDMGVVD